MIYRQAAKEARASDRGPSSLIWPKNSVSATLIARTRGTPEPDRHLDVRGQPVTSVRGEMLLVSLDRQELPNREAVDAEARELVLDAYRSAKISISDPQSKSFLLRRT